MKDSIINTITIIIQLGTLVLAMLYHDQFEGSIFIIIIGIILALGGMVLWFLSMFTLGEEFTSSLSPKGLVVKGVYAKIRHPIYIGGFLFFVGFSLTQRSYLGLILTFVLILPVLIVRAIEEEKRMLEAYGEEYKEYKKRTVF